MKTIEKTFDSYNTILSNIAQTMNLYHNVTIIREVNTTCHNLRIALKHFIKAYDDGDTAGAEMIWDNEMLSHCSNLSLVINQVNDDRPRQDTLKGLMENFIAIRKAMIKAIS